MLKYIDIVFRNKPKKVHYIITPGDISGNSGNETSYENV